jgi:hypothetical protein
VPTRQYVPAGQKPPAQRCPAGQHSHAGFGYCHPERRKHRAAHAELHGEAGRIRAIDNKRKEIGESMYQLARKKKPVPQAMRNDYARLARYIRRITGGRTLRG